MVPAHGGRGQTSDLPPEDQAQMIDYFNTSATFLINRPDQTGFLDTPASPEIYHLEMDGLRKILNVAVLGLSWSFQ